MIGHDKLGSGPARIIVLNDWMCDTSTWDGARAYLDGSRFTWAFADLRGYGRSMGQAGAFTLPEAAGDVLRLADALGWSRFAVIGHSMSSLVALHLAQQHPDRIERAVALTPPPPRGFGVDGATLGAMEAMGRGEDPQRIRGLKARWGDRLSEGWIQYKAARWRAGADPEAVAGYVATFGRDGMPDPTGRITVPVLAVTGEEDDVIMRSEAVTRLLTPLCERLVVAPIAECGHYPMQEAPPRLVAIVERFLAGGPAAVSA